MPSCAVPCHAPQYSEEIIRCFTSIFSLRVSRGCSKIGKRRKVKPIKEMLTTNLYKSLPSTIHLSLARDIVKELLCTEPHPTALPVRMSVIPFMREPGVLCRHHRKAKFLDFGPIKHCFAQVVGPDADLCYTYGILITLELLQLE